MKKISFVFFIVHALGLLSYAKKDSTRYDYLYTIHTNYGDVKLVLFDDTPIHKQNFMQLVNQKMYDSTTFHRVIDGFMIQGGDMLSKDTITTNDGQGDPGYTLPAEISSKHFHVNGAVCAARMGDQVNPQKRSSGSQFYIVNAVKVDSTRLMSLQRNKLFDEVIFDPKNSKYLERLKEYKKTRNEIGFDSILTDLEPQIDSLMILKGYPKDVFTQYNQDGGAYQLDGEYTVFGQVVSGMDVVKAIAKVKKDRANRPLENVTMIVTVEYLSKKKIAKLTGFQYK